MATLVDIAEAVKDEINAGSFNQEFTAERKYVPIYTVESEAILEVTVIPVSDESTVISRNQVLCTYQVDVGVQKLIGTGDLSEQDVRDICDPLMTLAEQIRDLLDGKTLTTYTSAKCTKAITKLVYSTELLDTKRVFMSVVNLTYEVVREP